MRWPRRRRWFRSERSPEGLPIGVQVVARPFQDETALGVAACVDAAFGYRPPPYCADLIHFNSFIRSGQNCSRGIIPASPPFD